MTEALVVESGYSGEERGVLEQGFLLVYPSERKRLNIGRYKLQNQKLVEGWFRERLQSLDSFCGFLGRMFVAPGSIGSEAPDTFK